MWSSTRASYLQESPASLPFWTGKLLFINCLFILVWSSWELIYVNLLSCYLLLPAFFISVTKLVDQSLFCLHFLFIQTDGSVPNTLVIANCEVVKPRVAAAEHISQVMYSFPPFIFFLILWHWLCLIYWLLTVFLHCLILQFNEEARSPFVKKNKTIIHPGEVSINSLGLCSFYECPCG